MKVVIMAIGSRGDIAPYTGLAASLRERGHDVAIATQEPFADMARECGAEYRHLSGDMKAELASEDGRKWTENGTGLRNLRATLAIGKRMMHSLGESTLAAAEGADVLMLQRGVMVHGYLIAKATGVPAMGLELFPGMPTAEFPPPMFGTRSLGRWANRELVRLAAPLPTPIDGVLKEFQRKLGLPELGLTRTRFQMLDDENFLMPHGFSPAVLPRPADWRRGADVVGYWWSYQDPNWQPPTELVDFLDAGPAPVFIGFGSMATGEGERLSELISATLRRLPGVRAVVQAGWAGMRVAGDEVLTIGSVPHGWLFPRMAAVVHHGGAGTTGAGVRAGVPAVLTPVLGDQPFWAARLRAIGVSPGSVLFKKLTAESLSELIRQAVTDPGYAARAAEVGARVRAEDGAARVAEALERIPA
ncbi:UDP-glucose:sterol glucosyltransferase [Kutzneria albida DSM 43870]|uniref:UDP-glucose:sterol glucosyltransferase n=2 Tax=Kutzneria TaxID=43356 RepID=W5W138_9PSEU|nr:UDP-glucose:sterol glucosyltransferase [Kutzneria albida DSM 43870]